MNDKPYNPLAPLVISESNLSHAWGRALWHIVKNKNTDSIKPLIVSLTGFTDGLPNEDDDIRKCLDAFLEKEDKYSVEIAGFTIFPHRYWQVAGGDRETLYQIYMDAYPHLQAAVPQPNKKPNNKGLYFQRLIDYGRGPCDGNQLEFIIKEYNERKGRTSKFQATTYDPEHDLNSNPYMPFPCLQHVSFVPTEDGLVVNAFYAMQYLVERGYGNFVGLSHLGDFMASQMGLKLAQVNIMAGVEKLTYSQTKMKSLIDQVGMKVPDLKPQP